MADGVGHGLHGHPRRQGKVPFHSQTFISVICCLTLCRLQVIHEAGQDLRRRHSVNRPHFTCWSWGFFYSVSSNDLAHNFITVPPRPIFFFRSLGWLVYFGLYPRTVQFLDLSLCGSAVHCCGAVWLGCLSFLMNLVKRRLGWLRRRQAWPLGVLWSAACVPPPLSCQYWFCWRLPRHAAILLARAVLAWWWCAEIQQQLTIIMSARHLALHLRIENKQRVT